MGRFNIHEAKTQFSKLVDRAAGGEEIVIAKSGKPVARLVAFAAQTKPRRPGAMRGKIRIKKDFDAPLPEVILAAFEGRS